jgi:hypothetical protein
MSSGRQMLKGLISSKAFIQAVDKAAFSKAVCLLFQKP